MNTSPRFLSRAVLLVFTALFAMSAVGRCGAALELTPEERDYIEQRGIIKAANVAGAAPIQYLDSRGEVQGISKQVLERVAQATGLEFEYRLYDTPEEVWESGADLIAGIPPNYARPGLRLSPPFLKSETFLYFNSALSPNELEKEKYAAVKGSALPAEVDPEQAVYYETREASLNAVEKGKAGYGYGNAFSVVFYTLQNNYKNIVTIPIEKEEREYCLGYLNPDDMLASIIDRALLGLDERQMHTIILNAAAGVERKITLGMVAESWGPQIAAAVLCVVLILLIAVASYARLNKKLIMHNRIYDMLSRISNEYLYQYNVKSRDLVLSEKLAERLGSAENAEAVRNMLRSRLAAVEKSDEEPNIFELEIPLPDGKAGVFKAINSKISDHRSQMHSIVGKLVDISAEAAERAKLIAKARTDSLTGLYNAGTIKLLITHSLQNREKTDRDALIMLDCNELKQINDTYGHLAGDKALKHVAEALKAAFRSTDLVGRVGGDEFCIFMPDVPSESFVVEKCRALNRRVERPLGDIAVSLSIGIACVAEGDTYEEIFNKADRALYRAKAKTGERIVVFGAADLDWTGGI